MNRGFQFLCLPRVSLTAIAAASALFFTSSGFSTDDFRTIETLDEVRRFASQDNVKVRLKPGVYLLDQAGARHFLEFTGRNSHWDFRGVKLLIDTRLFSQFGAAPDRLGSFYCAIALKGDGIEFAGLATENIGDRPGIQGKNKIFAITGSNVVLRNVDITTSGSNPWGYGSLFGIGGGDVKKMNGILVRSPAKNVKLIGCRVHMRAMGHAIFVQGAENTLIEDCHVDGLLRPTNEILAEKSGYAYERKFTTAGRHYVEGVAVGADGKILPDEMISLSEDGIRLYDRGEAGQPTGSTTIANCTVTRMRRGICTGLGPAADKVINCEVRDCVTTGFNAGAGDVLENCRADAKYGEALCLPYFKADNAKVDLTILDSRGGLANDLLAVINGRNHRIVLHSEKAEAVPPTMRIEFATHHGYAFYQREAPVAKANHLINQTAATVILHEGASDNEVKK